MHEQSAQLCIPVGKGTSFGVALEPSPLFLSHSFNANDKICLIHVCSATMGAIAIRRVAGGFGTSRGFADWLHYCRKDSLAHNAGSPTDRATDFAAKPRPHYSTTADPAGSP
jgi:hypothetical protein